MPTLTSGAIRGAKSAPADPGIRATSAALTLVAAVWLLAIVAAASSGALQRVPLPGIAALVATGIVLPTAAYAALPALRRWALWFGHRRLMLLHLWRIPAALVFFGYGATGELPPLFWLLAGTGDFIAGCWAWVESRRAPSPEGYRRFHRFGFADFVVAVGTGLTYTLLQDPRMAPLATLPLALIPLFGVGVSGAAHLVAIHLLRREQAGQTPPPAH
jgi:hypothetical protein